MKKVGFTLIEVCIAIVVLSAGIVAFGRFLDGFNRLRSLERDQAKSIVAVAQVAEDFVRNPPLCKDSSFTLGRVNVVLKTVPGVKPVAWVWTSGQSVHRVELRRLIRCKRIR